VKKITSIDQYARLHVFTPFAYEGTTLRAYMRLDDEDNAKVSGHWEQASVHDYCSGLRFEVEKASCNVEDCRCAAVVLREVK
jgi:hypothetical protein